MGVLLATSTGKRSRGRPKTRWHDTSQSDSIPSWCGASRSGIAEKRVVFRVLWGLSPMRSYWEEKWVWKWMNTKWPAKKQCWGVPEMSLRTVRVVSAAHVNAYQRRVSRRVSQIRFTPFIKILLQRCMVTIYGSRPRAPFEIHFIEGLGGDSPNTTVVIAPVMSIVHCAIAARMGQFTATTPLHSSSSAHVNNSTSTAFTLKRWRSTVHSSGTAKRNSGLTFRGIIFLFNLKRVLLAAVQKRHDWIVELTPTRTRFSHL